MGQQCHPEQIAIVRFLDKTITSMDAATDQSKRQIDLLRDFRTRLIADVVNGKLDVRKAAGALPEEPRMLSTAFG